jgi:ADP-heptose:LPS heptosyltransferase
MKNNHLVILDLIIGFVLLPLCLIIRGLRRLLSKIFRVKYRGILVIKFLGAGNFVAIQDTLLHKDVDILSAKSNGAALAEFNIGNRIFLIDDSNLLRLIVSCFDCVSRLLFVNYQQVINLETESKFAKFVTALTSSKVLSGVSNVHKSYIDYFLYDRYLVNPMMLDKPDVINLLLDFKTVTNPYMEYALDAHRREFLLNISLNNLREVVISPTGSNTDSIRRLSVDGGWDVIMDHLSAIDGIECVDVVFSSKSDQQYDEFVILSQKYPVVKISITKYGEFIKKIKDCDLVLTIDSQALHIAQQFKKPTIAIYGPSTPFGVNFAKTTYPVTRSLICSPCRHKYLSLPCHGLAPCMNFDRSRFEILSKINLKNTFTENQSNDSA